MAKRRPTGDTRKVSQLWYTPEQYALIQAAAKADKRSMVIFATKAAVEAARRVLATQGELASDRVADNQF